MTISRKHLGMLATALAAVSLPALASSTASSAAGGSSTSVSSVSDSFGASSNSVAQTIPAGDYEIVALAEVADKPDVLRMTLQPLNAEAAHPLELFVPREALQKNALKLRQIVSAHDRPYGTEFTKTTSGQAFLLILQDNWYRELHSRLVTL